MVLFERVQSNHLSHPVTFGFEGLLFLAEDYRGFFRYIYASSLYCHQKLSLIPKVHVDVFGEYSSLIWLSYVRVGSVHLLNDTSISRRKSSVLEDWGHVSPILASVVY